MTLELTTRSRRRGTRVRQATVRWASGLLILMALICVLPAALGLANHTVTDDAMGGTMKKGSAVLVDSVPVADLRVGDVITYRGPQAGAPLITRRIAQIDPSAVRTSGDGTGALDPWTVTLQDSTQDRVVAHVPYAGYVLDILTVSARWWLAGFLVALISTLSVVGARAGRHGKASHATPVAAKAPSPEDLEDLEDIEGIEGIESPADLDGTVVTPPRPRRESKSGRRSSV